MSSSLGSSESVPAESLQSGERATLPNPAANRPLQGRRILLVEDDIMISVLLGDALAEFGYEIVGPATRLAKAVELAATEAIDAAILDLDVAGKQVYPAAEKLAARGIPFAFVTGHRADAVVEIYRERPRLQKPFAVEELVRALELMLSQSPR
jgi:DNA-binding response OmpR family regulator